jgi:hypothetical protein
MNENYCGISTETIKTKDRKRNNPRLHAYNSITIGKFILSYSIQRQEPRYLSGIALSWMIGASSPGSGWEFSLRHQFQTGSGAHPVSYPMVTKGSFPGDKVTGT